MAVIQIALVDDHRLFRSGIASLIGNLPGFKVIFEAGNGEELMQKISNKLKPDIILLDLQMPVMDGEATARYLKTAYPDIKIIILSMLDDPEKVLAVLKLGIKGYLLKHAEPFEFQQALSRVAEGEVYFPEFVTRLLLNNHSHLPGSRNLNLREIEFLKLASSELTYKEIAEQMSISTRTVDGYRDHLFEKLNIKSRTGLVLYAIKNKLIEL